MLTEWWNRFVASDPGLRRLRTASRVALSIVLMLLAVVPVLRWQGLPIPLALFGAICGININLNATDPTRGQQMVTVLLCPLPAVGAMAVASVTISHPVLTNIIFLAVVFTAVYIRRFGPRWFALGMLAFMGYFFTQFIKPPPAMIPWAAFPAVVVTLTTFLTRFWLVPETPERTLRRGLRTLREQVHALLHCLHGLADDPHAPRLRRKLHNRATRLNETALMLEGSVAALGEVTETQRDRLRQRILDVELSAENLVTLLVQLTERADTQEHIRATINDLFTVLRTDQELVHSGSREIADRMERDGAADTALAVRRLGSALHDLSGTTSELVTADYHAEPSTDEEEEDEGAAGGDEPPSSGGPTGIQRPELRAAVQVTTATLAAIVLGHLVSPNRWYWAVITAFLVFIGAKSRGEIMVRAWQRTVGTILGVVAGILVAGNIAGNTRTELALIVVCIFLAFYFAGYAYSFLTFFITTALGLVYGVLGMFNVSLLELRLVETAIGSAVGVGAALFVLPTGTRRLVRHNMDNTLLALRRFLQCAGEDLARGDTPGRVQADARELDSQVQGLVRSAGPLTRYRFRTRRGRTSRWLVVIRSTTHYSHNLTKVLPRTAEMVDEDIRRRLAALVGELATLVECLTSEGTRSFADTFQSVQQHAEVLHDFAETLPEGATSLRRTLRLLERMQRTVQDLAVEMGMHSTSTRRAGVPSTGS